ncbi:MAG: hypothetical protein RL417_1559 [Pseudomonadota bacterium]|jgi:hypothetical protein
MLMKRCLCPSCRSYHYLARYIVVRLSFGRWLEVASSAALIGFVGTVLSLASPLIVGCIVLGSLPFGCELFVRSKCGRCRVVVGESV